jgi:hypothetical protein
MARSAASLPPRRIVTPAKAGAGQGHPKRGIVRLETQAISSRSPQDFRNAVLAAPLGLSYHQRGHQLRGTPVVADVDTAAAARVPAQEEELCFQEEAVFFGSAEHASTRPSLKGWAARFVDRLRRTVRSRAPRRRHALRHRNRFADPCRYHHPPPYRKNRRPTFAEKAKSGLSAAALGVRA